MQKVEKTGKTVDEAVLEALKFLNASQDEVEVEVVDEGKSGFLGLGMRPAKVIVTKKFDPVASAKSFLREVFAAMGMVITIDAKMKDSKQLVVELAGENIGALIGKRGQTLDSLQYIVNLVVNKNSGQFVSVHVDAENYRQRRKETLESLAINLAKKVRATKKSVTLEPMNPYERRIIHACLQNDKTVVTYSEGNEPFRHIVISAKYDKSGDKYKPQIKNVRQV